MQSENALLRALLSEAVTAYLPRECREFRERCLAALRRPAEPHVAQPWRNWCRLPKEER